VKTVDDFDFTFQRSVKQQTMAHLAQLDFLAEAKNVIFLPRDWEDPPVDRARRQAGGAVTAWRSRRPRTGSADSAKRDARAS
jgi:IstB-like ATP binding protein